MGKTKGLVAPVKKVDPSLDALFATSVGPAKPRPAAKYSEPIPTKPKKAPAPSKEEDADEEGGDDEELSELDEEYDSEIGIGEDDEDDDGEDDSNNDEEEVQTAEVLEAVVEQGKVPEEDGRKRKRKQRDQHDNLEHKYLSKLVDDDEEPAGKRLKADGESEEKKEAAKTEKDADSESEDEVPVHESLAPDAAQNEIEKANRTVFLSNVAVEAVTSRSAKKTLMKHMASVLDKEAKPAQKVESIRFRSTAFATAAIPKRAAYIKKSVMEATTKSTNAYVVYSTPAAARLACNKLNGTIVLDRHIRVDSVAHPAPVDHKRCVFVGNLGFVDDETVLKVTVDEEGKEVTEKKKRTKQPMDVEEGLWRVFGKEGGKVESVRVVRDPVTRVGKGFAYVQFHDENAVESAILLNGKKFPPMLPRELRVSRCKAPHKTARAIEAKKLKAQGAAPETMKKGGKKGGSKKSDYAPKISAEAKTIAGRAEKLLGKFTARQVIGDDKKKKGKFNKQDRFHAGQRRNAESATGANTTLPGAYKSPESFILEGKRASAADGKPKDLKFKGAKKNKAPNAGGGKKKTGRAAARASKWKVQGKGKK
ncbi:nucleolar protein 12 [Sordaria brevicollis]|uniref:Nucleolar protein 12 n=1 Tax=Sordaria brevicollis TaxID=83679 RepID=A0AAE0PDQ9_SORBR|nr:nucleolar protein 12 [Sordaria brevicollis]